MSLHEYLKKEGIWHRFISKQETVHTADAAQATGIDLHRITKNLISITDTREYVVLIIPGDRRVDLRRAAEALGVRNVSLMPFDDIESISGYPPGGTPSVGHKTRMRAVVDAELVELGTMYCGGGSRDLILEIRVKDVINLTSAIIAPISIVA